MQRGKDECPVCLDELGPRPRPERLTCGHVFHRRCLTAWFARGGYTCPTCRGIALDSLKASRAKLSTKLRAVVDTMRAVQPPPPGAFWPGWMLGMLGSPAIEPAFRPVELQLATDLLYQTFDEASFFRALRAIGY
jgi:hypothetical protein